MSAAGTEFNPYAVQIMQTNTGIKLQDLPPEILERMVPGESALALSRTSKTMRAAAHAASVDLVVEARPGRKFRDGLGLLAELNGFRPSWTVTVLRLRACDLRAGGGAALAAFLQGNTTLTELDVGSNYLQEAGGLALAAALRGNTTLTKLDLRGNMMGDRVGEEFSRLLRANSTLRCLNISYNQLGRSVLRFAWALTPNAHAPAPHNATLTSLALGGHDLRHGGAKALAAALRSNTTLTELDLHGSMVGGDELYVLTEALGSNTTLARLDLRAIDAVGQFILSLMLGENAPLWVRVLPDIYYLRAPEEDDMPQSLVSDSEAASDDDASFANSDSDIDLSLEEELFLI